MRKDTLVFIFVLGLIAFNWPFLKIFGFSLPLYIFSAWFLFIVVLMIFENRHREG